MTPFRDLIRAIAWDPLLPTPDEAETARRREENKAHGKLAAARLSADPLRRKTWAKKPPPAPRKCDHRAIVADHVAGRTGAAIAKAHGISPRQVKRILAAHRAGDGA